MGCTVVRMAGADRARADKRERYLLILQLLIHEFTRSPPLGSEASDQEADADLKFLQIRRRFYRC